MPENADDALDSVIDQETTETARKRDEAVAAKAASDAGQTEGQRKLAERNRLGADDQSSADLPTPDELDPNDDDPIEGVDPTPGERRDDGSDPESAKTLPIESDGTLLDAPAAAVLDPGPTPVTPGSSQEQYDRRVRYEDLVNQQLEKWIADNRAEILATFIAGGTVTVDHQRPDVGDKPYDPTTGSFTANDENDDGVVDSEEIARATEELKETGGGSDKGTDRKPEDFAPKR